MFYKSRHAIMIVFFTMSFALSQVFSHDGYMSITPSNGHVFYVTPNQSDSVQTTEVLAYAGCSAYVWWSADAVQQVLLAALGLTSGTGYGKLDGSCSGSSFSDSVSASVKMNTWKQLTVSKSAWVRIGVDPIGTVGSALTTRTCSADVEFKVKYPFVTGNPSNMVDYKTKSLANLSHSHNFYAVLTSGSDGGN